ncbi:MAG: dnaN [Candidatus Saccharibacteria bacterium]|nr:dnaN [Candidatus Saccharibacteria bacterium]
MDLQVTQENLSKALGTVARIANTRNTLPILANVLIKTVNNRLTIAATNLDIAITHVIGSKIAGEGAITVPARLMQDFVSSLPSGVITLKLEEQRLHISTDKYQSVINGISAEEYPVMPAIADGQNWKVAGQQLRKSLQQVVGAASSDEARPVLTGVYVHTHEGSLYMVATDSYRLAEKRLGTNKDTMNLLVPATAMQDLLRILSDFDEEVSITHDDQQVLFRVGTVELVARLIEGQYPDYRRLIPKEFATSAKLKRAELVNITKVSSLFARESAGSITIEADNKAAQVSIRSIASQLGENTASASAEVTGGGGITLNSRYVLDGLQVLDGDDVQFSFNGKLEPCVLKAANTDDYLHVIMPLKS